jgi:branched-chain amino acid transport system permease protein
MAGSILGSLFILKMGLPIWLGFLLALAGGAILGVVTEILAVRPVLKSLDQHLYVLSTLALALMVQQFAAIEWGTDAQPFPRILNIERNAFDQQFWLPMLACAVSIVGLEMLYRRTLLGHAFLAIAEDNYAARALGLPERNLRIASFAIAGAIGALAGFAGGQMLLAFFANAPMLTFYGFVPVALGGMGNNRGAVVAGLILGLFQQAANFLVGGIFASVAVFAVFISSCCASRGLAGARSGGAYDGQSPRRCVRAPARLSSPLSRACRS